MDTINVGKEFYHRLANRDEYQGDGENTAIEFREKYLNPLDNETAWTVNSPFIVFDFSEVKKIGPSFANEAFAYFTRYTNPKRVLERILFKSISKIQKMIIDVELETGYKKA